MSPGNRAKVRSLKNPSGEAILVLTDNHPELISVLPARGGSL